MLTIDADAHVIENEHTWEYMDESDRAFKPITVYTGNESGRQFWLIDGRLANKGKNIGRDTPEASREMRDVEARLKHMDQLKIDIQVLYPSIFLSPLTGRPEVECALARSYNRWLADICRKGESRLHWAAVVPLLNIEYALVEARSAKDNGACALYVRGIPEDRSLSDAYFYPLYDEASKLNLPICVHASAGSFVWKETFNNESGFSKFKIPVVSSFHSLAFDGIPKKFPKLRFGFIEVGAQWLPYVLTDLTRRYERQGKSMTESFLADNRLYVACQTNDDLAYIVRYAGEDNIVIGTDYGHSDTATEIDALKKLKIRGEVSAGVIDKILCKNPKNLYNL